MYRVTAWLRLSVVASMLIATPLSGAQLISRADADAHRHVNRAAASDRNAPPLADAQDRSSLAAYGNLPLTFIENRGQLPQQVHYYGQRGNFGVYLMRDKIMFSSLRSSPLPADQSDTSSRIGGGSRADSVPASSKPTSEADANLVALEFVRANPDSTLIAQEREPGVINYFHSANPAQWHVNLPQYSEMVYHDLWPSVDLRLRPQADTLKYEFRVRPGATVSDIRLAYAGTSDVRLDNSGALLVQTIAGQLRDVPPVTYQDIAGARVPVESRYVLDDATGEYGFSVDSYRSDHELIIDPGVGYSTFLGGNADEQGKGIAVDGAGNTYIVGVTQSPDFTTTAGAFDRTGAVNTVPDAFVAKLNPSGTGLVYATFLGGSKSDIARAVAIDSAGNAYIAGQTTSPDFPTRNAFDSTLNVPANCPRCFADNYDAFVTKLNSTGSALVYSTYLGGGQDIDDALGIAVDSAGNAYVTGETASPDFPITAGAFRTTSSGSNDAFVTKLSPAGSALVYSTFIGGSQVDFGVRIRVDSANNAYVIGNTSSLDFPTTPGAFDTTANGDFDVFVTKLNATGSKLVYSTFLGGAASDSVGSIAIDSGGNVYAAGGTSSGNFPTTPGAFQTASPSPTGGGGFVTKLNPTGSALVYSTFLGDSGCSGVAVTPDGNAWITGGTSSDTFPTTPDAFQASHHASASTPSDAFVTELNSTGSSLLYSTYLGGSDTDFGSDVGLDSSGNAYVTGLTRSADFPTTAGALDRVFNGRQDIFWGDAFITRFTVSGTPQPSPSPSPSATATLTVSATGRTGETVMSSPAGISVPVGSSAQASFAQGTSITLSVSNGRSAIWSGVCSSGGNKTPSCTFTLNADASEAANVQ